MTRRWRVVLLVIVLAGVVGWLGWRWQGQTVDVVIVNASGTAAQFSWQPQLFGELASVVVGGCESKRVQLRGGETWHFESDRLEANSSTVSIPLLTREVAVEIWLAPGGSSRLVPPYPVDGPFGAPYPSGCVTQTR